MTEGTPTGDDAFELESRRVIYQTIRSTPGIHFRELLRRTEYAQGTLQYHLKWMVNEGLIERSEDGEFARYYPSGEFEIEDKAVMDALRREYSRRIIAHLAADGPLSTSELAERLGKSASTVSWHLSRLADTGVVTKEREGRTVYYSLTDPHRVVRLFTVHQKSFTDRLLDRLIGLWEEY